MPRGAVERPTKVRIFGRDFSIHYIPNSSLGVDRMGYCEWTKQKISVEDGLTPIEEADTVLHEVIHGLDDVMGLKLEEDQVKCLATGILGILQDNPEFAKYLIKEKN